jgi:hypothetical protein
VHNNKRNTTNDDSTIKEEAKMKDDEDLSRLFSARANSTSARREENGEESPQGRELIVLPLCLDKY